MAALTEFTLMDPEMQRPAVLGLCCSRSVPFKTDAFPRDLLPEHVQIRLIIPGLLIPYDLSLSRLSVYLVKTSLI